MNKNVLIINGHQHWEMSPGELNKSLVKLAEEHLLAKEYTVKMVHIDDAFVPKD